MFKSKTIKDFPGTLFLIVGNSGVGKDSIISSVIKNYPPNLKKIIAPKRYITRVASNTENNIEVDFKKFDQMLNEGKFALSWKIYGLYYGIPIFIDDYLKKGNSVIVNASRNIVEKARIIYKNIKIILVKVPLDIIIKRLKERGRESDEELEKRIIRAKKNQNFPKADFIIDNSRDLKYATEQALNNIINNFN
ncbi:MAG: phosphonate metabolism protein/1,5-bisphosphokinase (PRPP-forming) PhnN [Candidatus Lokiarchaeota archaeon]|nr:phosphonate metabolism protein/1,5-bisphosphokinase (PRPP-forming) PhnN [Candidatus Lokiarchaeota archaeon]